MSELKDYIKIGYRNYKLDVWPDTFASTEEAEGEFFAKDGKIGIKGSTLGSMHGANTLLHEILHAIVYQYGLAEDIKDKEEKIVNTLTNGLSAVLIDNPWLLDYLKDKVKKEKESVNEKPKGQ
tara:strand:- start:4840 stop:5208 length:369 start_codon:yes stop_codon:yes gene_type:complete